MKSLQRAIFGDRIPRLIFIENTISPFSFGGVQDAGSLVCTKCESQQAVANIMICKPDLAIDRLVEWAKMVRDRELISPTESETWIRILSAPMSTFEVQRVEYLCVHCLVAITNNAVDLDHYDY